MMTGFSEAPSWWPELLPPCPGDGIVPVVCELLDRHTAGPLSTRELAELLWPEANVRGEHQVRARQRMYKLLMKFARGPLKDYCYQEGEPNKFGGIPYRWAIKNSSLCPHCGEPI